MIRRFAAFLLVALPALCQARKPGILAVFAHPDDEVWWGAGALLARYAQEGHEVHLVTVTSGQLGVTTHAGIPAGPELGAAREEELRCSARALGIQPPFAFGFHDQGLASTLVMDEVARRLRLVINQVKPEVIITHSPEGISGHIDHRITSVVTTEVFQEQERLQHRPARLYYLAYPESRIPLAAGATDGRRQYRTLTDVFITTAIDGAAGSDAIDRAIDCHKTQMTARDMENLKSFRRNVLGGIVYLRLVMTSSGWPAGLENNLFPQ
jgi:LmbE family N-acetylglucosaminyl deacetylase